VSTGGMFERNVILGIPHLGVASWGILRCGQLTPPWQPARTGCILSRPDTGKMPMGFASPFRRPKVAQPWHPFAMRWEDSKGTGTRTRLRASAEQVGWLRRTTTRSRPIPSVDRPCHVAIAKACDRDDAVPENRLLAFRSHQVRRRDQGTAEISVPHLPGTLHRRTA